MTRKLQPDNTMPDGCSPLALFLLRFLFGIVGALFAELSLRKIPYLNFEERKSLKKRRTTRTTQYAVER